MIFKKGKVQMAAETELQDFGFAMWLRYWTTLFESSITYMIINHIAKYCLPKLQIADGK